MTDLSHAVWRKARRSQHNGGCVEVAANLGKVVAVRDSKRPEGGAHDHRSKYGRNNQSQQNDRLELSDARKDVVQHQARGKRDANFPEWPMVDGERKIKFVDLGRTGKDLHLVKRIALCQLRKR